MNESLTLYHLKREDIEINIVARFEKDKLIIDGYDIGKNVQAVWGDSDYEYTITLPATSLPPLYALLGVASGDHQALLEAVAKRFNGNQCFSAIGEFLNQNQIQYESFSWA